jgi:hypothetical protein
MSNEPVNVICLKYLTRYGPHYVNRLRSAVGRHLSRPFRFLCFTENPDEISSDVEVHPIPQLDIPQRLNPSTWLKLALFGDGLADMKGMTLFLDLDVIITGSLDCFFDYKPDKICIIHNWLEWQKTVFREKPDIGNSSVFRFNAGESQWVLDTYLGEKEAAVRDYFPPQTYLTKAIRPRKAWWPDEWVRSFKRHCLPTFPLNYLMTPRIPSGARIIAFHGRPDPHQALEGYKSKWHRYCRPTPWIAEHWQ